jgi:hypothetical protein
VHALNQGYSNFLFASHLSLPNLLKLFKDFLQELILIQIKAKTLEEADRACRTRAFEYVFNAVRIKSTSIGCLLLICHA